MSLAQGEAVKSNFSNSSCDWMRMGMPKIGFFVEPMKVRWSSLSLRFSMRPSLSRNGSSVGVLAKFKDFI